MELDVVGIGNAIVDVLAPASDEFLVEHGLAKGSMTLIDEEPDYLSIAPDLTFRSRSRYLDETTGQWVSETEVIESPAELVELYNPGDIFAAFAEAAREAAGLAPEPTAAADMLTELGVEPAVAAASRDLLARLAGTTAPRSAGEEG